MRNDKTENTTNSEESVFGKPITKASKHFC